MKFIKKLFLYVLFVICIWLLYGSSISYASENLSFDKNLYLIDDFSEILIEMNIPEGYTKSDITFKSEDEKVAKVSYWNPWDKTDERYYEWEEKTPIAIQAVEKFEKTKIQATIEGTEYFAETEVSVINPIEINWKKDKNEINFNIISKCSLYFLDTDYQALEIGVRSKNDNEMFKWERLGFGKFGEALNKSYTYTLPAGKDYEVCVRWLIGAGLDVGDGAEWVKNSIIIEDEDIEIGFGEHIYITQKDGIKTIQKGNTLQLDIYGIETLSNIKNEDVTWSSSNNNIATVDSKGLVKSVGVGKVTIKAEYGSYSSTYEIEVKDESNLEPPIDIIDDTYDFFSNKKNIEINVGTSDKVEITAKMKDGLVGIALVEMVKDNWNVEWKIEDETIAKCIPETGIENNKYGGTQIVGRASIQGLKTGNTTLVAKIKISENRVEEIKIPITVGATEKDNNKKEDKTVSPNPLPQTGEKNAVLFFIVLIVATFAICFGIKYKKK